ncbi:uncharacterized protein BDZ99DRAFT_522281 [Mytilinidion resinicola]|uniref:Uncharacterized protein n=1 Tax=Mytilinidion resinicola TaxID=574789 RepID=A0A6A6YGD8_9PEZI|nr:uncharacterized protein BDZ99DRAFT_522281 [Mytilinidion resinicola]KAF2807659.1 hypothetical protein BDZ99DRAFT_522281 [Mytilinidion resinicola]
MDASDAKQPFLPNGLQHVVLTQDGLRLVVQMEPRLILDISKEDIEDKEKANGLAKFIVCFQALWFCIVCIARVAQGLQISILELNVFAHAICTLLIYLLWWDKPLDFQEPTLIRGEDAHPICAFFSVMKGSLGDDALPWQKAVSGNFSDKEIIVLSGWGRTSNNASIESDTAVLVEATTPIITSEFHFAIVTIPRELTLS